ncbi:hypothetical protein [Lichenifustis flavocetrariae]|uniref:Uncharacterized protein n=1 Tax=Lichenifustis flavocetrariae TaxID=2949735 RepID=A0AA42CLA0_9HYPH|nr:hypothetical protein [Lichenifustis flavocetrariae]MCW6507085.1 hypothetical protein [Lichenifustis flavocetrariae]
MPTDEETNDRLKAMAERLLAAVGDEHDVGVIALAIGALVGTFSRASDKPVSFLSVVHRTACAVIDGSALDD